MNTISICYPHPSQYHGGTVFFPAILALTWIPSGKFFFLNTVFSQQFSDKSLSNPLTCFSFRTPSTVLASAPCFQTFCIYQHYCGWAQAFQPLCWTYLLPTVTLMISVPPTEIMCACLPLHLPAAYAFGRNKDTWQPQVHFAEIFSHTKIQRSTSSSCLPKILF